jgi:predicted acylesterase/phospholipase RssA
MKGETLLTEKLLNVLQRRYRMKTTRARNMKVNKEQQEHAQAQRSETVLVLQGGGSLGAYERGY